MITLVFKNMSEAELEHEIRALQREFPVQLTPAGPTRDIEEDAFMISFLIPGQKEENAVGLMEEILEYVKPKLHASQSVTIENSNEGPIKSIEVTDIGSKLGAKAFELGPIRSSAPPGFTIVFSELLTPDQVVAGIEALAEYYRQVGGLGFDISFEYENVESGVLAHA